MRQKPPLSLLALAVALLLPLGVFAGGSSNSSSNAGGDSGSGSGLDAETVAGKENTAIFVLRLCVIGFLVAMSGLFSGLTLGLLGLDTNQLLVGENLCFAVFSCPWGAVRAF